MNCIKSFIHGLKDEFICDDQIIRDILNLTEQEYEKKLATENYSLGEGLAIAEHFGVSIEDLIDGKTDYKYLKKKFLTPSTAIPDRYLIGAGTYMGNIRSIVNFSSRLSNGAHKKWLQRKNYINDLVLANDDLMVNVELANNLLKDMQLSLNLTELDYLAMAIKSYDQTKRKALKPYVYGKTNIELAEFVANNASSYDLNFEYSVEKLNDDYFYFIGNSREEISDLLQTKVITNEEAVKFRAASVQVLMVFAGNYISTWEDITINRNKKGQEFRVLFKNPKQPASQHLQ